MEAYKKPRLYDCDGDLNQRWYVFYYFRHPESNKYTRFKEFISCRLLTKSARYQRANEIIRELGQKLAEGWNPFQSSELKYTRVIDGLKYALSVKQHILRRRSLFSYRSYSKVFMTWLEKNSLEKLTLEGLNYMTVQKFMDSLKSEKHLENRTYNNYITALKSLFNFLIERGYIYVNPFVRIKKLHEPEPEIIRFSNEELQIIRTKLSQDNFNLYLCAVMIYGCFIRPAELVRLRIKDIDMEKNLINIHSFQSKNKREQTVRIPTVVIEKLRAASISKYPGNYLLFSKNLCPGIKEIAPTRIAEVWRKWADRYKIDKNIYHLKHTGAGLLLENGGNVRDIQLQMRHSEMTITQIYLDKFSRMADKDICDKFPPL